VSAGIGGLGSARNLEEIMAERNLPVDHVTIWRWVQRYAPELNRRGRRERRMTNRSWRADETYLRVAGKWTYLYRAVDSTGATVDFHLSARQGRGCCEALLSEGIAVRWPSTPRVINVDGNLTYPRVIGELKRAGELGAVGVVLSATSTTSWSRITERSNDGGEPSQGFRPFDSATRTIQGIETVNMIRKGQVRWLEKGNIIGQIAWSNQRTSSDGLRLSLERHATSRPAGRGP
jgi:transposase, IS6 family